MTFSVLQTRFVADDNIATKYGVTDHPKIVFFRNGVPALFDGRCTVKVLNIGTGWSEETVQTQSDCS